MARPKIIEEWMPTRVHYKTSDQNVVKLVEQGADPAALLKFVEETEERGERTRGNSAVLAKALKGEASLLNKGVANKFAKYLKKRFSGGSSGENLG